LIIGTSAEETRVREQYGIPARKIHRIFNPLDTVEWQAGPRRDARIELGIGDSTRIAIWHGRIDIRRKGLDVLLDAWKDVCAQRPDREIVLILIGSGPDAELFDKRIQEAAVPRIHWIRNYVLDRPKMRQYLSAADVYVFPSRHEGFPVAPLEAMACGLPIVAACAPGICDILNERENSGGIVVPIGDPAALADGLGRLLDNANEGHSLGIQARLRVERGFSLQTVGGQLQELFQNVNGLRNLPT
jgi:starch synthase